MSNKAEGLRPWPSDPESFVAACKSAGHTAMWDTAEMRFVSEKDGAKVSPEPWYPVFFGLPHASPYGMPKHELNDLGKRKTTYMPLEDIEGVKVKFLYPDVKTGCGVYLRADAYEAGK